MEISQLVRVRHARWRIAGVRTYDSCALVTVVGLESRSTETIRHFLTPFDILEPVQRTTRPLRVGARRWRRFCRRLIAEDVPPGSLRSPLRAQIDLLPHQLEPALAVVRGIGTRVLLADAVGLGKTIQAGLIVAELHARGYADRVLVLAPAGLREQWAQEMRLRFGFEIGVADAPILRRMAAELPVGVNPWTTMPMAIASVDYVKRPEVLPAVRSCQWDVIVVDEAHGTIGDSDRHAAVEALSACAPYLVLVTTTPHSGDERAFASLCGLGQVDGDQLLVFRRPRAIINGAPLRRVLTLRIRTTAAEARMHAELERYTDAIRAEHGDRCLALSVLHKRAFSGPWALAESAGRRLTALSSDAGVGIAQQPSLPLGDPDGESTDEDQPPVWPTDLSLADTGRERRLLTAVVEAARAADENGSKLRVLGRLLRRVGESIIVFTEYRDTLLRLRAGIERPAILLHGGLRREDRERALQEFSRQPGMVLLATDAAGQGLNLQRHCRIVVSLELPWNPMRLEQRIGRVDRIGQRRRIHAIHFVGAGTNETRILSRLRARIAQAGADIGAPDPFGNDEGNAEGSDERAAARLVLAGNHEPGPGAGAGTAVSHTPLSGTEARSTQDTWRMSPDLGTEAAREVDRLAGVRRFLDKPIATEIGDREPLIARARRWRVRQALRGRTLLIWRAEAVDGAGNVAESRVIPVLVVLAWDPASSLEFNNAATRALVDGAARDWRDSASRMISAFWATRLRRERGIAARGSGPAGEIFQPGLFDLRAERARREKEEAEAERAAELGRRLATLERRSRLDFRSPRLLLVLVS